jgi:hypothetical protein
LNTAPKQLASIGCEPPAHGMTRINQSWGRASVWFTSAAREEGSRGGAAAGRTSVAPGMHSEVRVLIAFTTMTAVASAAVRG